MGLRKASNYSRVLYCADGTLSEHSFANGRHVYVGGSLVWYNYMTGLYSITNGLSAALTRNKLEAYRIARNYNDAHSVARRAA